MQNQSQVKTNYRNEFSGFSRLEKAAIRISLWKRVVDMEMEGSTDGELYEVAAKMFEYLDLELNLEGEL